MEPIQTTPEPKREGQRRNQLEDSTRKRTCSVKKSKSSTKERKKKARCNLTNYTLQVQRAHKGKKEVLKSKNRKTKRFSATRGRFKVPKTGVGTSAPAGSERSLASRVTGRGKILKLRRGRIGPSVKMKKTAQRGKGGQCFGGGWREFP